MHFNVNSLLELAGVKEITLYTSDDARNTASARKSDMKVVKATDAEPTIITLDTNYGIANFKQLMEKVLLPILKKYDKSVLSRSLKTESMANVFGIRGNQITSTFSLKNLNTSVSIRQFQELLTAFDLLDTKSGATGKITNSSGDVLKWRDLLYVYNLVVNNDSYGDKRLTPLFEYYMKESDSLGFDYVKFSAKLDTGELNIYNPLVKLSRDPEYISADTDAKKEMEAKAMLSLENDILFHAFQRGGRV